MSANTTTHAAPSGAEDFRDVATAHTPFRSGPLALRIVIALVVVDFGWIIAANENFGWPVVAQYFFDPTVLNGLYVSLGLTVIAMILGVALGLVIAIARMSSDKLARSFASLFIWFFRGTPLLVQLIFWYNMSTLFPTISISLPFGPTLISWDTNSVITPLTAAIVGLALNEAAYMAEIIRGGLLSVDRGQTETAEAFGMTKARALWRIIIPQAMRSIVPPTGNQLISMIKATSIVSVIAMADLLYSVQSIYNRTFEIIPMLLVAVIWYLLITSVLNIGQSYIEAYYGRSDRRNGATPKPAAVIEEASH
ncbi:MULTISPECIES: amino acid ABC transporter permease [unclassified Rhizobium]|uniref:amino acid ABC transporter permease n=1 Tax=unclassified Rhizobium TaxID=2613769 RepID=UPI00104C341C|nr:MULTISPECIES: amino acid ABC transporter permease [unclassified Rhizobium]MBB3396982.1 polar amino acid transport system permease protein [Rhizobium sp. BK060]MBB4171861.1 polar amino acid transport system permease protein [Rhizobium sp. BK538]TCM75939.1 polar amino acid transport system permease protein [Rhizobium sp. BK068]